jgi:hypothetical protein
MSRLLPWAVRASALYCPAGERRFLFFPAADILPESGQRGKTRKRRGAGKWPTAVVRKK